MGTVPPWQQSYIISRGSHFFQSSTESFCSEIGSKTKYCNSVPWTQWAYCFSGYDIDIPYLWQRLVECLERPYQNWCHHLIYIKLILSHSPGNLDYYAKPTTFEPPSPISEKGPITPVENAFLRPQPPSNASSQTISSEQSNLQEVYEKAKLRGVAIQRKHWVRLLFEYSIYAFLVLFVYFVLVGMPLWKGAVWWLYYVVRTKFVIQGGYAIIIGLAAL